MCTAHDVVDDIAVDRVEAAHPLRARATIRDQVDEVAPLNLQHAAGDNVGVFTSVGVHFGLSVVHRVPIWIQ